MTEDTKPNRLGITPGEAVFHKGFADWNMPGQHDITVGESHVAGIPFTQPAVGASSEAKRKAAEALATARLIADAFNTANRTQKLPSELAAEVERLREAVRGHIRDDFASGQPRHYERMAKLKAALDAAEGKS